MSLFRELKRRNVFRVGIAYLAGAWLLIEVAGTLFPAFGIPDWGVRFMVIVFALGFLPALIVSWAYEITPEGIKREKDVVRDTSITHVTAKRLDGITISLIVAALAFILADRFWLSPRHEEQLEVPATVVNDIVQAPESESTEPQYPPNSIAVLPFVNMSDDAGNEYFSDGVSEELLNLLAKIPELRVVSRSSAFSFKGKDFDIPMVAAQLHVAHVLEGSVRKAGNQVRITVQLIETHSDTHLWSETYDRTLDDIFAIQDEIATEVVQALVTTLLGDAIPKVRETNPEAYALYLMGKHFADAITLEGFQKADTYLHEALAIDPDYAPAWEELGSMLVNHARAGFLDYDEGHRQARMANQKALELDPNFAEAYSLRGYIAMMYDRDLDAAAKDIQQARILAPNDSKMLGSSSTFAETLGRIDQAIEFGEHALRIDPLSTTILSNMATVYSYAGRLDQAEESFRKALELRPDMESALPWLAKLHLLQGRPDAALSAAQKITDEQQRLWTLPMAYHDLGQTEESDMTLSKLKETYADTAASYIAENHAWRGEIDPAFDWLDRAIEEGQFMWGSLVFDPAFKNLHTDPRWQDIRIRVGRSEEQLKKIEF